MKHETVLLQEAVNALEVTTEGIYIDATFGRGGHSKAILAELGQNGRLIALDQDPEAIAVASKMQTEDKRLEVAHTPFSRIEALTRDKDIFGRINGILFDLGVSSPQLDKAERGFSFMQDGPLDMRMNPNAGLSAEQWINTAAEKEIADVMYKYGEERHSRRIARRIVLERTEAPITTTGRLAEIVKEANPAWEKSKHPATRAFQGIRIFINSELDELESALEQALDLLQIGGRLVVISFHSLEDRMVKKFMVRQAKGDSYPRNLPIPQSFLSPRVKLVSKAVKPGQEEISKNPRARSAVMRVAEKIA